MAKDKEPLLLGNIFHNNYMDNFEKRLKALRGSLGVSRREFSEKHGIPEFTIRSWELGKTKISKLQLKKLISAFEREGLFCDSDWLLNGKGTSPFVIRELLTKDLHTFTTAEKNLEPAILESKFFQENNKDAILLKISDHSMTPSFEIGDIVGGIPMTEQEIEDKLGTPVLLLTEKDELLLRIILPSDKKKFYNFSCINLENIKQLFLNKICPKRIYKIIWIRKNN